MEKTDVEFKGEDFLEIYCLLMNRESPFAKTPISGIEIWENPIITHDPTFYMDTRAQTEIKEDSLLEENAIVTNPTSTVEFTNLKAIYEKVQSRAGGGSAQRISGGVINVKAISEGQLCGIHVFVERLPEAAILCGDVNGQIPLEVTYMDHFHNQQLFSVDLDSVYHTPNGTPVYKLATVDSERRNLFHLVVFLKFIDGAQTGPYTSSPFLIRSRKPRSRSQEFS